ncbi:hypothetical protein, partial [Corynebacterium mastitidis]|uniref:hypothetical protein n=1 Tax=Corynebacterium mastitidis TaxID=161890 RepID=UPI0012EAF9A7
MNILQPIQERWSRLDQRQRLLILGGSITAVILIALLLRAVLSSPEETTDPFAAPITAPSPAATLNGQDRTQSHERAPHTPVVPQKAAAEEEETPTPETAPTEEESVDVSDQSEEAKVSRISYILQDLVLGDGIRQDYDNAQKLNERLIREGDVTAGPILEEALGTIALMQSGVYASVSSDPQITNTGPGTYELAYSVVAAYVPDGITDRVNSRKVIKEELDAMMNDGMYTYVTFTIDMNNHVVDS